MNVMPNRLPRRRKSLSWIGLLATLAIAGAAHALEIQAKPAKTESNAEEEIWVIRIELKNTRATPLGPLVIQFRRTGFSEFESDGTPTTGKVEHTAGTLKQEIQLEPGERLSIDTPGMNFAGDGGMRRLAKGMFQDIRVRAWHHGQLIGELGKDGGASADQDWLLDPPAVPIGIEVGPGPWLLLEKTRADFHGLTLGASAAEVHKMLKSCGPGQITATPEPIHGHPLRMTSTDLPGVTFGFVADKALSAIEITEPSRLKLPGGLVLGKSKLEDFDPVFGTGSNPDPLPPGATNARQFKMTQMRITLADTATTSGIAMAALLEKTP